LLVRVFIALFSSSHDAPATAIYTLSLHDALPISRAVAVYVPPRIANQEIGEHAFIAVMITRLRLYIRPRTPGCWLGGPHHHQTFDNGLCLEPPLCCRYPHCVHEEVGNDRLVRGKGEHFFRHNNDLWVGEVRNAR